MVEFFEVLGEREEQSCCAGDSRVVGPLPRAGAGWSPADWRMVAARSPQNSRAAHPRTFADQCSLAWSRRSTTSESTRWRPTASFDPSGDHRNLPTVAPENLMSSRRGEPSSG